MSWKTRPACGAWESAGAQRGQEIEISLKAVVDLHGGIAGTNAALALAPRGDGGNLVTNDGVQAFDQPVIEAHQAQSAAIRIKIGSQIVKTGQSPEVLRRELPIFNLGRNQHAVRNRLSGNPRQHRPPVIEGEL